MKQQVNGVIKIDGAKLEIKGITSEDLVIDGDIVQIQFLK
jgi:hypothetical protein